MVKEGRLAGTARLDSWYSFSLTLSLSLGVCGLFVFIPFGIVGEPSYFNIDDVHDVRSCHDIVMLLFALGYCYPRLHSSGRGHGGDV